MKAFLGISACYHDAAACRVRDGETVAAVEERRQQGGGARFDRVATCVALPAF